jgi:uncharacterized protein with HEPN domain
MCRAVRDRFPEIPWRAMAGLRDIIIHQYDRLDYSVPYRVVTEQLQPIIVRMPSIIKEIAREEG